MAYGIKETKEVLDLVLTCVNVGVNVAADGKVGVEDGAQLMQLLPVVGPAFGDIAIVPKELAELSGEEAAELVAHIGGKLALNNEQVVNIINKSLKTLHAAYELYMAIKPPVAPLVSPDPAPAAAA